MPGSADCLTMAAVPETRFAETPGGRIAYQVVGDGPINVLVTHSPVFPIDHMWDEPSLVRFLDRLSSFSRHVWFDPRGWGASDPLLLMARTLSGGKRLTSANPQCGGQERRVAVKHPRVAGQNG